ncbi:hypothetical protein G7054_g10304 [Neopestalotiopsis clavispora]|nr:hypothetical protein G7054_g10304 [Neopestalotiopsis clavispora]
MAELVGLVASSIAIVETAGKVACAVLALKKLWDEIQDVPDTVRNLMTEIEVLEPILTVIEDDFSDTGSRLPNDRASQLALAYCRKAVNDLEELVRHLSANLQAAKRSKRGRAKVRFILEKETLRKLQDRMQAAVRLLTLAQQTYLVALTKSQPEIIFRRLEATSMTSSYNAVETSHDARQFEARTSFSRFGNWRTAFGNIAWGRGREDENTVFGWMTRFESPAWLSQRAWDLRITHSTSGWQVNLKPYCVRSRDDVLFDYAMYGATQALEKLIRSGQASVYDIDENGYSLLHFACFLSQVELVEQLLLWGADITLRTFGSHETPVHRALAANDYNKRDLLMWPAMDHLLTSIGAYEDIEDVKPWRPGSHQGIISDYEHNRMTQSVEFFKFFQPVFSPNHYELDIHERLDHCRVQWRYEDDVLRYLLFSEGTVSSEQIQALEKRGVGPLNLVAYGYQSYYTQKIDSKLRIWVRDLVKLGADLHFEQHSHALPQHMRGFEGYPYSTPFFGVLIPDNYLGAAPYPRKLQKQRKKTIMSWLKDLQICSVDLERKNKILKDRWYHWDQWVQLSDFEYGPEPKDWILKWDLMTERFVGEFWAMIEEQMQNPQLPGTWVDSVPDIRRVYVGYHDSCEDYETSEPGAEDGVAD